MSQEASNDMSTKDVDLLLELGDKEAGLLPRDVVSGARSALQAQVDELLGATLPEQVVSLSPEVKPAPVAWLGAPAGLETEAFYVSATIKGLDEHYSRAYRCRFVVGGSYSTAAASRPPVPQFMDQVDSLALGEEGRIWDIFDSAAAWTVPEEAPSLRRSLRLAGAVLQGSPPAALFDTDAGMAAAWQGKAHGNRERERVITAYTQQCLTPPLFHAPTARFPDLLSPTLLAALAALRGPIGTGPGDGDAAQSAPGDGGAALRGLVREEMPGVYSFEMFQEHFCEKMIAELENFEESGLPLRRPNSMNNYGVLVNEMGMSGFMTRLQEEITQPISSVLFPVQGEWLDHHHSFSVRYTAGEDLGLDMHSDDSDVTFNTCLGKPGFTAAGLTFCGIMGRPDHRLFKHRYVHAAGRCVVHLGRQRHGADDISEGTRVNLIMWNKSQAFRASTLSNPPYQQEEAEPSEQCLSYTHDRDFGRHKEMTSKQRQHARGWCPPTGLEFPGSARGGGDEPEDW